MKINDRFLKIIFYVATIGGILVYLVMSDLLKWIIAGAAILYLIFYFSIATIAIFSVTITEMGGLMNSLSQKSPLLAILLLVPVIIMLWFVLLLFWPLFVIPDRSFVRNPEKYEAINDFEAKVRAKYFKF